MERKGLIVIYTGHGKGKTTASLGQAIRGLGQGLRVCVVQFIKGKWPTGEAKFFSEFKGPVEFHTMGTGFTWDEDREQTKAMAATAWNLAKEKILSRAYDMIVLDELTYLIKYELVSEQEIIDVLLDKPECLHIIISGRDASQRLIDTADLVSEISALKHPYVSGIKAQKGIEF
nr:cob(I)yrinic acid a,c-diamide adenosyltransferase [Desulfobulbaceae bacterium]